MQKCRQLSGNKQATQGCTDSTPEYKEHDFAIEAVTAEGARV